MVSLSEALPAEEPRHTHEVARIEAEDNLDAWAEKYGVSRESVVLRTSGEELFRLEKAAEALDWQQVGAAKTDLRDVSPA